MHTPISVPVKWMDQKWKTINGHRQADGDPYERQGWIIWITPNCTPVVWARDDNSLQSMAMEVLTVVSDAAWDTPERISVRLRPSD